LSERKIFRSFFMKKGGIYET
jgi:hypothetical protein